LGKVVVNFYGALVKVTGEKNATIDAQDLTDVVNSLITKYDKSFKDRLFDKKGKLARFLNIYVNGKDIRFLNNLDTELNDNDTVSLVPAVGGG
jgi:MoaD family protein